MFLKHQFRASRSRRNQGKTYKDGTAGRRGANVLGRVGPATELSPSAYLQSPRILASWVHTGAGGLLCKLATQAFSSRCIGG